MKEKHAEEMFHLNDESQNLETVGNGMPSSFKVFWSDQIITEPKIINYYKIYLRELIDENKLLGNFDQFGKYYIDIDIRRDLAKMYKEI